MHMVHVTSWDFVPVLTPLCCDMLCSCYCFCVIVQDYPVERYLRDLRVHSILEGTNEIMRLIIHRQLGKLDYRDT